MAALSTLRPNLLDLAKRKDPDGAVAKVIEMLTQSNDFVRLLPMIEGNTPDGHLTTVRTGLPPVTWTKIYQGVQPGKSTTAQVKESVGTLKAYGEVSDDLVRLSGNPAEFRLSEEKPQIEAFSQEFARALIYENEVTNPERFTGLAPRFSTRNSATAACGENVIHGGGAGTDNASIWLLGLDESTVHGLVPKGSDAGLVIEDKGKVTAENIDGSNGRDEIWRTFYRLQAGLCVRDWRYVVRICNIDKSNLTIDLSGGSANLPDLMFQAIDRLYSQQGVQPVFLMSRDIKTMLGRQVANAVKNSTLDKADVGGVVMDTFQGIPIARTDALAADEALVPNT